MGATHYETSQVSAVRAILLPTAVTFKGKYIYIIIIAIYV